MTRYFFLSEGWLVGRVWEFGGIWNEATWRRKPKIQRLNLGLVEQGETLWLYEAEEAVLMLEVRPEPAHPAAATIGQVMLKRLMDADQVIHRLTTAESLLRP
ncbi:hypothetical protein PN441_11725 [Spirulina major CS-329]|jgi:hypothetical protein|uniref:hypothetical protein n=1 Tax=Spirulina TaxID=1154 RepID=UPI0023301FD9|nr:MULTISPECIES: hypothetical protein [Spirulina]MDB9496060.1 hypothetical protein [Spirulina subsalsa CS-330]MDB9503741.1 hypothetical protein [Spirulina major CS-329]